MSKAAEMAVSKKSEIVDLETLTDVLEVCDVQERLDLGSALVIKAIHPLLGAVMLVNTSGVAHAMLQI